MEIDIRATDAFGEVTDLYSSLVAPGTGHVYGCTDIAVASDGASAVLVGLAFEGALEDGPGSALYHVSLGGVSGLALVAGGEKARLPRFSPRGADLAWVLPGEGGRSRIVVAEGIAGTQKQFDAPGLVEDVVWSPDGGLLLAVVAGVGADVAGFQGGYTLMTSDPDAPDWLPSVATGQEADLWRAAWTCNIATGEFRKVSADTTNVWEASWCGDAIAVVASDHHSEGSWYRASLRILDPVDRGERTVYEPQDCVAFPRGAADGHKVAFVEAVASDRGIICGVLKLLDLASGDIVALDTAGVDVTSVSWAADGQLHFAGQNASRTCVGTVDCRANKANVIWESTELTCGQWFPFSCPLGTDRALLVAESFNQPPALSVAAGGALQRIHDFGTAAATSLAQELGVAETVSWQAPDGMTIHGVLIRPQDLEGPAPLVLDIHGGPVWVNRNRWMIHSRTTPLLLRRGYCILYPNPRGSACYGQDFARLVQGDMGGADTQDFTSALDHFISVGLADPQRLGCTGASYGGYMSSWLVTQDDRFAAAAPISPVINWISQHLTSQIPYFDELFLADSPFNAQGRHVTRSPVMFVDRVKTPTLLLAGGIDKNTPPTQALEFHNALLERGIDTALVTYPRDGHSLRGYPAYLDSAARILMWFERYLGAGRA